MYCVGSCASRTSAGGVMPMAQVKVNLLQQCVMHTRERKGGRNCLIIQDLQAEKGFRTVS